VSTAAAGVRVFRDDFGAYPGRIPDDGREGIRERASDAAWDVVG
jgi:hypothetical protein